MLRYTRLIIAVGLLAVLRADCSVSHFESRPEPTNLDRILSDAIPHSLTRVAVLEQGINGKGSAVLFSTLEGYHQGPDGDRTQLVSWNIKNEHYSRQVFMGSSELRAAGWWQDRQLWVFGGSLEPALVFYDPANERFEPRSIKLPWSGWIHGIGIHSNFAAVSSSGLSIDATSRGVYQINMASGEHTFFPFGNGFSGSYSAVDTIDPSGRIWFYTAYPYQVGWVGLDGRVTERTISWFRGWLPLSWDSWLGPRLVVSHPDGGLGSLEIADFSTLKPKETGAIKISPMVPVDLFNRWQQPRDFRLYFDTSRHEFVAINKRGEEQISFAAPTLSGPIIATVEGAPGDFDVIWRGIDGAHYAVLGVVNDNLLLWKTGTKRYYFLNRSGQVFHEQQIPVQNLSAASISSLAITAGGEVWLSAFLTHGEVLAWDPKSGEKRLLENIVVDLQGQIDWLFSGNNGVIYGGGYPNATLFSVDPSVTSSSKVLWRGDHHEGFAHFHRVAELSGSSKTSKVAAIIRSDYSHLDETALVIIAKGGAEVNAIKANDLNVKHLLSVHVDDYGNVSSLAEDENGKLVLLLSDGANRRELGIYYNKKIIRILGQRNGEFYLFDGQVIKSVGPRGNETIFEVKEGFPLFVGGTLYVLNRTNIKCISTLEEVKFKDIGGEIDLKELRYSQLGTDGRNLYIGFRSNLYKLKLPRCN